ncbi:MAG: 16S rRNA (adenine(1518)-N(6)/adenine(1519)-N(6))-dimethyltransferase RsmA [Candidatus Ratteibacteria bacterium]|jgi:16S rRNA (adenine1518-N6/adenine1519-N6)-dimethyltransferase
MTFLTKTALRQLFAREGIVPNKGLGQNFLIDKNVRDKFLSFAKVSSNDTVLEIGPGLGALTEQLCKDAKQVIAFEKDAVIAELLKTRLSSFSNLEIITKDFLTTDPSFFSSRGPFTIIGNLPYYIASPIILHLLRLLPAWTRAIVSLPEEVGEKIIATHGDRDYGFLAVTIATFTQTRICYTISRHVFYPMPKIKSVLLEIVPRKSPAMEIRDTTLFWKIIPGIFENRRKTILNVLARSFKIEKEKVAETLKSLGIDFTLRSHQITLTDLEKIVKMVEELKKREAIQEE